MKTITGYIAALSVISSMALAGGDIEAPVVVEDVVVDVVEDQTPFYLGLALTAVSARDADASLSFTSVKDGQDRLGNFTLLAGYEFNEYLAVEGRYNKTFTKRHFTEMSGASLFAKAQYPATEELSVYLLAGYGNVQLDNVGQKSADIDESSFQWGLGASYDVTEEIAVFADYTSLLSDASDYGVDTDAITVGVRYSF